MWVRVGRRDQPDRGQALADGFSVSLVKTTLDLATLGQADVGYVANIDVDRFARYLVDLPSAPSLAEVLATPTGP